MKLDHYLQSWDEVGRCDPMWGILADPSKYGNKWDPEEFYRTGTVQIDGIMGYLGSILSPHRRVALDFGCGAGRLSRRLSVYFHSVIAVDASPIMLDLARKNNSDYPNIQFIQNREEHLRIIGNDSVDFIYSDMTLQHLPSVFQEKYIEEFCRVLSLNGVLVFQTPSHHSFSVRGIAHLLLGNRLINIYRRMKYGVRNAIEVHTIPRSKVEEILRNNGLTIHRIDRYDSSGQGFVSYRYCAKKETHPS